MSSTTTRCEILLEAVPDALVGMDQKGVIRFVNRQTESLFCYDRDQLIGQPIDTLVPETLWAIYSQHQEDYFADPRTRSSGLDLELRGRRQDGREFPVNISMSRIDTGDVLLVITAVVDVAKHRQAVRKAQLTEAIVESCDVAIMSSNLKGIITSWNPAATRMYGYCSREIIGKSASVLCPEDRIGDEDALLVRTKDGQVVDVEAVRVRKDGTAVPASITVSPLRDASGDVVGTCAIHRDVTKQRQAFQTAQHLAAIVEYAGDAIIGSTLDGMITCWNRAAERMFGYFSRDIVGKPVDLLLPEQRAGEAATILAKIRAGQVLTAMETRVRKDGTVFPVSVTVSAIRDTNGAIVGVSNIARSMAGQNRTCPVEGRQKTPS